MNGEARLNEFVDAIEVWKSCKQLPPIQENENINKLLGLKSEGIRKLTSEDKASGAYELYIYAEYLQQIKTKEKIILDWAESSIWYIIADRMSQYGDKYTKWQEKYYSAGKIPIALLKLLESQMAKGNPYYNPSLILIAYQNLQ